MSGRGVGLAIVLALIVFLDRLLWAALAPWEAEMIQNLRYGYIGSFFSLPAEGLRGSAGIPSPNGMAFWSLFLSRLPNFFSVSAVLGVVNAVVVAGTAWVLARRNIGVFLLAFGTVSASVMVRAKGAIYWNPDPFITLNLVFIFMLCAYLRRPSYRYLPVFVFLMIMAPGMYLSGLSNAVSYAILFVAAWAWKRPVGTAREKGIALFASAGVVAYFVFVTWIPYFEANSIDQLRTAMEESRYKVIGYTHPDQLRPPVVEAVKSLLTFPRWVVLQWAPDFYPVFDMPFRAPYSIDSWIVSMSHVVIYSYRAQALLFLASLGFTLYAISRRRIRIAFFKEAPQRISYLVVLLLLVTAYVVTPLLGGPKMGSDQRPIMTPQFLPLFLIVVFLGPILLWVPARMKWVFTRLTWTLAAVYCVANLAAGVGIAYETYRVRNGDLFVTARHHIGDFVEPDGRLKFGPFWPEYSWPRGK